jgi:hypothetical protein
MLPRRWLNIARAAGVVVVAATIGLAIPGFVAGFRRPGLLRQPQIERAVAQFGLP